MNFCNLQVMPNDWIKELAHAEEQCSTVLTTSQGPLVIVPSLNEQSLISNAVVTVYSDKELHDTARLVDAEHPTICRGVPSVGSFLCGSQRMLGGGVGRRWVLGSEVVGARWGREEVGFRERGRWRKFDATPTISVIRGEMEGLGFFRKSGVAVGESVGDSCRCVVSVESL